jgi:hypothetical protein
MSSQAATSSVPNHLGITLGDALRRWETHLRSSDRIRSQRTVGAYLYGTAKLLGRLGTQYELHAITPEDIEALMAKLKAGGMSPGGRAVVYRPIRTAIRRADGGVFSASVTDC